MRQRCVGCGAESPETVTSYTLIGSSWRVMREVAADGSKKPIWRCPACWSAFKKVSGVSSTSETRLASVGEPRKPPRTG